MNKDKKLTSQLIVPGSLFDSWDKDPIEIKGSKIFSDNKCTLNEWAELVQLVKEYS